MLWVSFRLAVDTWNVCMNGLVLSLGWTSEQDICQSRKPGPYVIGAAMADIRSLAKLTDMLLCLFVHWPFLKSNSSDHCWFALEGWGHNSLSFDFLKKDQHSGWTAFNLWGMDKKAALSICFAHKVRGETLLWPVGRGCCWSSLLLLLKSYAKDFTN